MMNELNFLDLAVLKKIDAESSVEKFGSMINTSFFETANLLGTIKIKGYVGIESSLGGISRVIVTDAGSSILSVAEQRAQGPIEPLDNAILHAVAGGTKDMDALQSGLNIRSGDLAFHLNKLIAQGFMDCEIRAAKVSFVLTEQGFNATGGVRVQQKLPVVHEEKPSLLMAPQGEGGEKGSAHAEQKAGFAAGQGATHSPRQNGKAAPPWVDRALEKAMHGERKEDVKHLLSGDGGNGADRKKAEAIHEQAAKKQDGRHAEKERPKARELTPEEEKREERRRRMASKAQYYVIEYAPYALLLIVVLAIFAGAIYLAGAKYF